MCEKKFCMNKYHGISYIGIQKNWFWNLWKRYLCPRGSHLLDEVLSSDGSHYLSCDACGLIIQIKEIDTRYT